MSGFASGKRLSQSIDSGKTMLCRIWYLSALFFLTHLTAMAVEPQTEHTFRLSDQESRPQATLEDARWLVGSWEGTAFGQKFEEVWNPPSADSMVGMFKLFSDEGVAFYELLLLTVEEGTLSLKVKHFNADFTAWEEKADFINFRLVKIEPNALHFGGISFYRRSNDQIDGYIVMKNNESVSEHKLVYQRIPATPK